jgi:hypothetical protein
VIYIWNRLYELKFCSTAPAHRDNFTNSVSFFFFLFHNMFSFVTIFYNSTFPFIPHLLHMHDILSLTALRQFNRSQKLQVSPHPFALRVFTKWRHSVHTVYGDRRTITTRQRSELRSAALSLRATCFHVFVYRLHICLPA